jgi:hypothetical protein
MKKIEYAKSIRNKCLDCAETREEVRQCPMPDCSLYNYRLGTEISKDKTRLKAIRNKCFWCMNGLGKEIKYCQSPKCPLFIHRCDDNDLIPVQECP